MPSLTSPQTPAPAGVLSKLGTYVWHQPTAAWAYALAVLLACGFVAYLFPLSFLAGHAVAWIYMLTHTGLSYSRSYVSTLIVLPVVVALVMMVLSNNVVLALGLMAIFAMVRFRTILRDSLDTAYVLAVVVIGLA